MPHLFVNPGGSQSPYTASRSARQLIVVAIATAAVDARRSAQEKRGTEAAIAVEKPKRRCGTCYSKHRPGISHRPYATTPLPCGVFGEALLLMRASCVGGWQHLGQAGNLRRNFRARWCMFPGRGISAAATGTC